MLIAQDLRSRLHDLPMFSGELPDFDVSMAPDQPVQLFIEWLSAAIDGNVREPHAAVLSTVGADGAADARVLVLKDVDDHGWWFATSSESTKGRQLRASGRGALTFYWRELGRQVRVRGSVVEASKDQSAADFLARSLGGRAVALGSRQSEPLSQVSECRTEVAKARDRLESDPGTISPAWALYALVPEEVEFFQGDPERLHTRLRYTQSGDGWSTQLLWP